MSERDPQGDTSADRSSDAVSERTTHRVLVVANETVGGRELLEEIERRVRDRDVEVLVVAPALVKSRFKQGMGDVDAAIEEAKDRLSGSVEAMSKRGIAATGVVGDSDPRLAIEDALRTFQADEVIISTHPENRSRWLEKDVVEQARQSVRVPITHVVVDLEAKRDDDKLVSVENVEPAPAEPERSDDEPAAYMPPMPWRDRLTVLVGILGTITLGILAAICPGESGSFSGGCAARALIAIGAFMVSLWHIVALLVMGSIRYRGAWESFAADTVLFGIPPAIVVSLLLD